MSVIRRSMLFSAADKYLSQVLLVITTMVMARLLTPAETGLYVIASSIMMLADNLRTFGVGIYVVQTPQLLPTTLRSAFTVTMLLSLSLMCVLMLSASAVASFFGAGEIESLLRLAALAFLVVPFATPIVALLQRELNFRTLAFLNVLAAVTNSAVTIGLAVSGMGPESYVWGFLASSVVLAVAAICIRPQLGIFRPCLTEARAVLSFGAVSSAVTVVNMAYEMLPRIVLGKLLSMDAVGLYARAVTVCQLPDRTIVSALQPVVLPVLAAQARDGGDLRASYLHGHVLMSAIQWPMLIMLALLAEPVVLVLLGPQWIEAAPLVRMIAIGMMAMAPAFLTFPILVATGRIRDSLWSSVIILPPSALLVIAAGSISTEAVAASMMILAPFQMAVAFWFVRRAISVSWREMAAASRDSLILALATAAVPLLVILFGGNGFSLNWAQSALAITGGFAGWVLALRVIRHPAGTEIRAVFDMLVVRIARSRRAAATK